MIGFSLLLLLCAAAWHDLRSRRIPNALVYPGTAAGFLLNSLLSQGMGGLGALDSLAGLGAGLLLLLPLYLLRAMGAGDVKLMAMAGAFLGARGVTSAFIYVLLAGGLLAIAMAWRHRKPRMLLPKLEIIQVTSNTPTVNPHPTEDLANVPGKCITVPYGVAIAAGMAAYLAGVPLN